MLVEVNIIFMLLCKHLMHSSIVSLFFFKDYKEILHDVNGKFPGSSLIAIMGPSGAGKSTLLDVLSGFKTTGVNGTVLTNGRRRDLSKNFSKILLII